MDGARTMARAHIEIDGHDFLLDPDRDLVEVMGLIENAARSEPTFVDLSSGEELVSVLVSPGAKVIVTVAHESVATPEEEAPIAPFSDWEL